jgi:sigma-54 dependent transcriptional regulator, acetoin dehydrogenase operon transcriptional activator AcoR
VRAALALSDGDAIGLAHLPAGLVGAIQHALPPPRLSSLGFEAVTPAPTDDSAEPVREALLDALRQHRWNVSQAARSLQTCRATVYRRMQRFGVVPPNRRE